MTVLLAADATNFAQVSARQVHEPDNPGYASETHNIQRAPSSRLPVGNGPMLVALAGCAFCALEASGAGLNAVVVVAVLLLAGVLSYWDRRGMMVQMTSANTRLYTQRLHDVTDASLTRWSRHIDTARQQTETAGSELKHDFAAIRSQLQAMLDAAGGDAQGGVVHVLTLCNTRRMVETAAHLSNHVFPHLPVRQWVLSVPKRLRYFMKREGAVLNMVLRIFLRVMAQSLQTHCPGAAQVDQAVLQIGAVAFIHRFGSSLNGHVHFHVCVVDGMSEEVAVPAA